MDLNKILILIDLNDLCLTTINNIVKQLEGPPHKLTLKMQEHLATVLLKINQKKMSEDKARNFNLF